MDAAGVIVPSPSSESGVSAQGDAGQGVHLHTTRHPASD